MVSKFDPKLELNKKLTRIKKRTPSNNRTHYKNR